jgi:hypothetical protein
MITITTDRIELVLGLVVIVGALALAFVSGFVWHDVRGDGRRR